MLRTEIGSRLMTALVLVGAAWASSPAAAIDVAGLKTLLEDPNERVVALDIRRKGQFERARIPGSVHVPAAGIETRGVPPFGRVVVVWDGIDEDGALAALAALNQKPGIEAELLDGGYPAWAETDRRGGGAPGMREHADLPSVDYRSLMKLADAPDVTVIDLRADGDQESLTDIGELLPGARIISPLDYQRRTMKDGLHRAAARDRHKVGQARVPGWLRNYSLAEDSTYVVIDGGDGRLAERVVARMQARGIKRAYVLAGGELALKGGGEVQQTTTVQRVSAGNE